MNWHVGKTCDDILDKSNLNQIKIHMKNIGNAT